MARARRIESRSRRSAGGAPRRRGVRPTRPAAPPSGTGATRMLAEWVAAGHAFPDATIAMAQRCVLDWLGAGIAGADRPAARIAARIARQMGGPAESTLLAGGRVAATGAALANGVASHAIEMDDLHRASVMHLAVVTIPAALALGERERISGRCLLDAIVCGYEVGARVGEALGQPHYHFWHTTGTAGTFAAAAAGAVVLRLSPDATLHALGNAGTLCAGLWEFLADGAMSKTLHAGRAAETGVLCALLARDGFTGASAILEGEKGVLRSMAGGGRPEHLTARLGGALRIDENSFKLHAACGHTHPAVDAALELRRLGVRPSEIAAIRVGTFRTAIEVTAIRDPRNPYQAKFSLPFCVALALARGRVGLGEFTEAAIGDPDLRALADRVSLVEEAACNRAFPGRWQATVTVTRTNGRRETVRVEAPRGTPQNPASRDELRDKFAGLCDGRLDRARRDALVDAVDHLAEAPDVAAIAWGSDANDRG
ncbi:MAG TPA: MmgE/PrpD family protein [bacterium]|nr:MmgE/PrpD family protein [bacterium]